VLPGIDLAIGKQFSACISAYTGTFVIVNICDYLALDVSIKGVHNGLVSCTLSIKFEDGVRVEVGVDEYCGTEILDELTTTAAVMLTSLSEDGVGAFGEAVEVEVPELILIQFDFEQILRAQCGVEMLDHALLNFLEFHSFSPFDFQ
jgi:hypothetical protein